MIYKPSHFLKFVAIKYDHKIFPGAVPRTFIGSVLLAWLSVPVIKIAAALELVDSKVDLQIIGECCPIPSYFLFLTAPSQFDWFSRL